MFGLVQLKSLLALANCVLMRVFTTESVRITNYQKEKTLISIECFTLYHSPVSH